MALRIARSGVIMKRQERQTRGRNWERKGGVKSAVRERGISGEGETVYLTTQSFDENRLSAFLRILS
jgi:hypothetical protein